MVLQVIYTFPLNLLGNAIIYRVEGKYNMLGNAFEHYQMCLATMAVLDAMVVCSFIHVLKEKFLTLA